MIASRLLLFFTVAAFTASAQYCDKIDQRDADMILGGQATPLGMGVIGCSYSVRGKGARLTLTLSDEGANAKKNFDLLKKNAKNPGWYVNDELTLGLTAFSEWIKASGPNAAKVGFIVMKGSKLIQFYITDSTGTVGRRETLDKLRPIAKRVIDRI